MTKTERRAGYKRAYIGLGGNIGEVYENLFKTLEWLDDKAGIEIKKISNVYKTPPWGVEDQDWFVNACAELDFSLSPMSLLENCLEAEQNLRRERIIRWGPRTIDVDILYIDDFTSDTEALTVPHPRMQQRSFVIQPLAELNDQLIIEGHSVAHWLAQFDEDELALMQRLPMDEQPQLGKPEWRISKH